jgi:hypothetical protein
MPMKSNQCIYSFFIVLPKIKMNEIKIKIFAKRKINSFNNILKILILKLFLNYRCNKYDLMRGHVETNVILNYFRTFGKFSMFTFESALCVSNCELGKIRCKVGNDVTYYVGQIYLYYVIFIIKFMKY